MSKIVGVINVTERLQVPQGSVNVNLAMSDKGIFVITVNPEKVLKTAGQAWKAADGRTGVRTTNSVAKIGRGSYPVRVELPNGKLLNVNLTVTEPTNVGENTHDDQTIESMF